MFSFKQFLCLLLTFLIGSPAYAAPPKVAVFPFDMHDAQQDGEIVPQYNPEDQRRLKLIAEELKTLMAKDGKYDVLDLSAKADEIEKASPFHDCGGCEVPIAKAAGADMAVTGYVDKITDALLTVRIVARDANTGELTKTMSATLNGNTDELWLHGLRYLWRNRFNVEAPAQ